MTAKSTKDTADQPIFVVHVDQTAAWHHSTFPEPLITVDHDAGGAIIKIVATGNAARQLTATINTFLAERGIG